MSGIFERHAFVAVTTTDLPRARKFWVEDLGFPVLHEEAGDFLMVDAGGVRLCVDKADGGVHQAGSMDPVVGLKVKDLKAALAGLAKRGLRPEKGPIAGRGGSYAEFRDPDGRTVVVTEYD
jgi:catechol 2,3-dioxygenase-like lactoylglutathione lyase family enzyme